MHCVSDTLLLTYLVGTGAVSEGEDEVVGIGWVHAHRIKTSKRLELLTTLKNPS